MKLTRLLYSSLFAIAFASTSAVAANEAAGQLSPEQTKQIQKVVHDYLISNPQVLVEASQALQQQQMGKMQQNAQKGIAENAKDLFDNPNSPVAGNPKGNVTVIEFMDYQCGHCKEMSPIIDQIVKADPEVRVVIKEFPIFGETSEFASKAAIASVKQGKFWPFHLALMKDTNPLSHEEVLKIAKSVGIDTAKLESDMKDPAITDQLKDNFKLAQALGLMGTPALVVGNQGGTKTAFVPGTTSKSNLEQLIAQVRK